MNLPVDSSSTPDPGQPRPSRTIRLVVVLLASIALAVGSLVFDPIAAVTIAIGTLAALDQLLP